MTKLPCNCGKAGMRLLSPCRYVLGLAHSHGLLGEAAPEPVASAADAAAAAAALRPFLHEHSEVFYHELRHTPRALQSVLLQNVGHSQCLPTGRCLGALVTLLHASPHGVGLQKGFAFCCGCDSKKWLRVSGKSAVLQHYSLPSFNWEAALC